MYRKISIITLILLLIFIPFYSFPLTLVRVGYVNLNEIINTYTKNYLDAEIETRENYINQLLDNYYTNYTELNEEEKDDILLKMREQNDVLSLLNENKTSLEVKGNLTEDFIYKIIQQDIMEAIKKTSEIEGFNIILDNTGNFIYGSEDVNLTDKVLFRLDEKILNIQNSKPLVPLILELGNQDEVSEDN